MTHTAEPTIDREDRFMTAAVAHEIQRELIELRERIPDVAGVVVATIDGMLIMHDTHGPQPDTLAAMSAAQVGIGRQFASVAAQGQFHNAVIHSESGYVAVFAADKVALLTVYAATHVDHARLHAEARPAAMRIGALLAGRPAEAPRADPRPW